MNKKELNKMKKEFKSESTMINIKEIYGVYLKKDNNTVLYAKLNYFDMLDSETQDLYLGNFKKILGGSLQTKLFDLEFKTFEQGNEVQINLNEMIKSQDTEEFMAYGNYIVDKISNNFTYDTDVVITFIRGEYWAGKGFKNEDDFAAEDDVVNSLSFIMATVNKVEPFKKTLIFDYAERELKPSNILDTIINLNTPADGFMFPYFDNGYADVNKILFYNSKPKELNYSFVEDVLSCNMKLTADEEKSCFTDILKDVVGDSVKPEVMQTIYTRLNDIEEVCEEEDATIGAREIRHILKDIDIKDVDLVDSAFEKTCGKDYSFNIRNIVPDFNSKSLKIYNEDINISINPKNLNGVKQIRNVDGKRCLMIELEDDVEVEGFKLPMEE